MGGLGYVPTRIHATLDISSEIVFSKIKTDGSCLSKLKKKNCSSQPKIEVT